MIADRTSMLLCLVMVLSPKYVNDVYLPRYFSFYNSVNSSSTATNMIQGRVGSRISQRGTGRGECGARAYNRGLEAEPPAGSRDNALVRGHGRSPLEAEKFLFIFTKREVKVKDLDETI